MKTILSLNCCASQYERINATAVIDLCCLDSQQAARWQRTVVLRRRRVSTVAKIA